MQTGKISTIRLAAIRESYPSSNPSNITALWYQGGGGGLKV